jgi:hypothetical protein
MNPKLLTLSINMILYIPKGIAVFLLSLVASNFQLLETPFRKILSIRSKITVNVDASKPE